MVDIPEGIEYVVDRLESVGVEASGDLCIPPPCGWVSPAGLTPLTMCGTFTMRADLYLLASCVSEAHCELSPLLTKVLGVFSPVGEIELDAVVAHPIANGELPAYRIPIEVTLSEDC